MSVFSCGQPLPLKNADKNINDFAQKMADSCFYGTNPGADLKNSLLSFKNVLDEAFKGKITPQTEDSSLKMLYDPGLQLSSYPPDDGLPGAIVARPMEADLNLMMTAVLWDDQIEVYGPERYVSLERDYNDGIKEDFLSGAVDYISYTNHIVDVGQMDISFKYDSFTTLTRLFAEELPEEGVVVLCMQMQGEAQRVKGGFNAYLKRLHSFNLYYPIDGNNTYRVVGSWTEAGGSLFVFGSSANSGNIGEGIITEFDGLSNWLSSH